MAMNTATTSLLRTAVGAGSAGRHALFSTSSMQGAAKKAAPKAQQKKKVPVRKSTGGGSSGPRSMKRSQSKSASVQEGLSKTNPFVRPQPDMSYLPTFVPEQATEANVGQVMAWSERTVAATRIQTFGLTREMAREFKKQPRPRTLLRPQSLRLFGLLDESANRASTGESTLLQGPLGAGASTLMLQAVSYALESDWLVVYIPKGINIVDSSTPFVYSSASQTYIQAEASKALLTRILSVNGQEKLREIDVVEGAAGQQNVADLIKQVVGEQSPAALQRGLETVMRSLVQQQKRPMLLGLDGAQAYFSMTKYRDPDFRMLQSYEVGLPRTILSSLRRLGAGSFGGVQRGVTLLASSPQHAEWWPWTLSDETHKQHYTEANVVPWNIGQHFTSNEAASLADVVRHEQNRVSEPVNDETFLAKLAASGANLGVFERSLAL